MVLYIKVSLAYSFTWDSRREIVDNVDMQQEQKRSQDRILGHTWQYVNWTANDYIV